VNSRFTIISGSTYSKPLHQVSHKWIYFIIYELYSNKSY